MIYLSPGTNTITLTLAEKTINTPAYYTFELSRKGSFETVVFTNDDNSYAPQYWNRFTVSVGTTIGLTAGLIYINSGEWTYTVYEMNNPYDLNIADSVQTLETGICVVTATYTPNNSYTGTDNSTLKYYKNL